MEGNAWFVAETLPRSELRSQQHLENQRFTCFFPRFRKIRRHARKVEQVLSPVFPGYIFVQFDPVRDSWRSINGTTGVKRLVGPSSSVPLAMPDAAMRALMERCDGDIVRGLFANLQPGQQVRFISGPFAKQLGLVEHLDYQGRVQVLLDILGRQTSVSMRSSDLGPA